MRIFHDRKRNRQKTWYVPVGTDTPLVLDYQDVHRDTLPLFPETGQENATISTFSNQLSAGRYHPENGPMEITRGTI